MFDFNDSPLFTPVTHPESGVTFYVLTHRVAPLQQGFYFVNDSMSADGRYLWFYCAFPPALHKTLAVIDLVDQEVRHFPETSAAGAYVEPETGDVFFCEGTAVWRRSPHPEGEPVLVNQLPPELVDGKDVPSLASHLTRSADGKELFINAKVGLSYIFGSMPLDGGPFQQWWRFDRHHNHAQFSPTDPDEVLFAQEFHNDPITGLRFRITDRLWVMRRGEAPRPILREPRFVSHEWWDDDGEHVWCVDVGNNNETWRVRVSDGEVEKFVFPRQCWHSHSSRDGRWIVGDSNNGFFRGCASTVHFMNRDTGKIIVLAEHEERADYVGRNYHIDPHPRFCANDQYVVYTTTVRNEIDLAVVPVVDLIEKSSAK
ncbi:MAG: hypothetical protein R2873_33525 [Caldilineaceae bacterium]